jgi:hypothetical protein
MQPQKKRLDLIPEKIIIPFFEVFKALYEKVIYFDDRFCDVFLF